MSLVIEIRFKNMEQELLPSKIQKGAKNETHLNSSTMHSIINIFR